MLTTYTSCWLPWAEAASYNSCAQHPHVRCRPVWVHSYRSLWPSQSRYRCPCSTASIRRHFVRWTSAQAVADMSTAIYMGLNHWCCGLPKTYWCRDPTINQSMLLALEGKSTVVVPYRNLLNVVLCLEGWNRHSCHKDFFRNLLHFLLNLTNTRPYHYYYYYSNYN